MKNNNPSKSNIQLVWGCALVIIGIAVFFRIPQVMPKLIAMGQSSTTVWFIRICFYLIGIVLLGGGIKKINQHMKKKETDDRNSPEDPDNDLSQDR